MAQRYQYSRIDLATDAIRLVKLPKGDQGEPIRYQIFETYLNQAEGIPYEALSYVWGNRQSADMIWLDGYPFEVTENLYEALMHLRRPNEDRVLWIDAICIDQSHNAERGHQVRQMRLVYENAQMVIVWLGASNLQIDRLFDWMTALDQQVLAVARPHTMSTWENQWCWVILHMRGQFPPDEIREALAGLLGRKWFSRIWVLQEAALAKSAIITCGRNEVNSRAFVVMPSLLGINCGEGEQSRLDILPGLLRAKSWWGGRSSKSLAMLIQKFGRSKASDPRDIIYALLGLSADAFLSEFLRPDYQMSLEETIQQSVAYLMMQSHDLPKNARVRALPKWNIDEFLDSLPDLALNVFRWAVHHAQDVLLYDLFVPQKSKQDGQLVQRYMSYSAAAAQDVPLYDSSISQREIRAGQPRRCCKRRYVQLGPLANDGPPQKRCKPRQTQVGASTNHGPPITIAMKNENMALVELLLQFPDLDIQTVDSRGISPVSIALGQGNTVVADLMLRRRHHDTQWRDPDYYYLSLWRTQNNKLNLPSHLRQVEFDNPLLTATRYGDSAAVVEILAWKHIDKSIHVVDSNGDGLLNLAARRGDKNTLNILLQQPYAKYLLSLRGSDGLTPLESALVVDSPAVIDRLLDYQDHAVHEIVRTNQFDFLDKILDVRTRLLDKHSPGFRTPLAAAAWAGNTRSMELILDKGTDIDLRDRPGRLATPLWIATSKGDLNMVRLLVDRGADIELMAQEFPTHSAFDVENSNPFSIQPFVFADGTSLRDRDSGKTRAKPIWVASSLGYTDIVSFLIQRGADIEARDSYFGMTPFWRAAQQNHPEVMRVVIEGGADIRTNRLVGLGHWLKDPDRHHAVMFSKHNVIAGNGN